MNFLLEICELRGGRRAPNRRPAKGFTLVELMIVIACIAILAAGATPFVLQYLRDAGLKQAVYQISGDLYRAKSQAIRSQSTQSVNFAPLTDTYGCANPTRTVDLKSYRGSVTFTGNPDGSPDVFSPTIAFDYRGLSTPAVTTQVYLADQRDDPLGGGNGRLFRVQVSAAGAVSINEWRAGQWIK